MKSPFRINTLLVVFILSALVVGLACVPSGSKKGSISNDRDDGNLLAETGDSVLTVASCVACHREATDIVGPDPDHPFNQYIGQTRTALADSLDLSTRCGVCHAVASPELVSKDRWSDVIVHMRDVFRMKSWPVKLEPIEWLSILHYYAGFAPTFAQLPSDPAPSGLLFTTDDIGNPKMDRRLPMIGNVSIVDLDQNGVPDILATDFISQGVVWLTRNDEGGYDEIQLNRGEIPAKTEVVDFDSDGDLDIVLANIGSHMPTEKLVGSVEILLNNGEQRFASKTVLDSMGRLSDARPADLDGDGDLDIAVTTFGFLNTGEVGWLEQTGRLEFTYRRLLRRNGGLHIIPTDADGDGDIDLMTLITQEHEEILLFLNNGDGTFEKQILFKAPGPTWGFSGIELVDLDDDGDEDILATNGDAIDLPNGMVLPYHGVRWFENRGNLEYRHHEIFPFYGAYRAVPGDLDGDGDLDIAVVTMMSHWTDKSRMSAIWLENDGDQSFKPHGIGNERTYLMTCDIGDLDGDGDLDIVAGGMNVEADRFGRIGRIVRLRNDGTRDDD